MKTLQDLIAERAELVDKAAAIQQTAQDEKRELTEAEDIKTDDLLSQIDALEVQIEEKRASHKRAEKIKQLSDSVVEQPESTQTGTVRPTTSRLTVVDNRESDPTHGFKNMGDFARCVIDAANPSLRQVDERLNIGAASGLNEGVGAEGGYLVPEEFVRSIWDNLNDPTDSLMARTTQFNISGNMINIPANAEVSRATGSRYGGVQGYWIEEAGSYTASNPTLRKIKLEPKKLGVLVYLTEELMEDSAFALESYVQRAATDEINYLTGESFVRGTGAGQPQGILNSNCLVSVAKESGQSADTIVAANINKMYSRMHARARRNGIWLINQDIEPQLWTLKQDGSDGTPIFAVDGAGNMSLRGRPVVPIEYASTLGDQGDIIFADMSSYLTARKGGIRGASSMHVRFLFDERAFKFTFRVDGQPALQEPIAPAQGAANTLSTFVTLDART